MPDLLFPLLIFSTFLGALVQGITGFAFAIILLAFMQSFLPYTELLTIASLLALFMLTINVYTYRKHITWKWLPLPLLINFTFTIASIQLLRYTADFPYWHELLGLVFILMAVYLYCFQHRVHIEANLKNALIFCGAGGILGGLFGVGGPPVVVYFLALSGGSKEKYLSSTQMFFWFNMSYDFIGRAASGMVTADTFYYASFCLIPIAFGLWLGRRIVRHIDIAMLKKLVYLLIFLNGWYMLLFS